MNDVFKPAGQPNTTTTTSLLKLNQPLQRNDTSQDNHIFVFLSSPPFFPGGHCFRG